MKEFLTDSIYFKKKHKDFLFFANDIFIWRVDNKDNEFFFNKSIKKNIDFAEKISAVVSPSNYRLINDVLILDDNAKFYYPSKNKDIFLKKNRFNVDKKAIKLEFERYMKRGYISYLSYSSLKNIGLKRIEQFVILLSSVSFEKDLMYDNIKISKNEIIKKVISDTEDKFFLNKKVKLLNFIYVVHNELNYEFIDIFSHILKLYSELKCTDPFDTNGVVFFEDDNPLYDIYKKISNKKVFYRKKIIYIDNNKIVVNTTNEKSKILINYYFLQKEDYFEGKILESKKAFPSIINLIKYVNKIIPFKDVLLTLQLLERMNKISIFDMRISINSSIRKRLEIRNNKKWAELKTWSDIYKNLDYIYNDIIDPIYTEKIQFECPLCGNNVYSITPQQMFCSKMECNFAMYRTNLKSFGVKKISLDNMIDGLKNKSVLLEKDDGGQLPVFLKKNSDFYSFWINED